MKGIKLTLSFLTSVFILMAFILNAQVSVTYDGSPPHNSAMLDVKANDRGMLVPRMTAAERQQILNPAQGLIIFCTDCPGPGLLQMYVNGSWMTLSMGNTAPRADNITQSGTPGVGQVLTGIYTYYDADGDPESGTQYQWSRDGWGDIPGANSLTYTMVSDDLPYCVRFKVMVMSQGGNNTSNPWRESDICSHYNNVPVASNVTQSGGNWVGATLTGNYLYSDLEGDPQDIPLYQWYVADDGNGLNESPVPAATGRQYVVQAGDAGKYLRIGITPVAQSGNSPGLHVKSAAFKGPILATQPPFTCGDPLLDERDGQSYNTVQIGSQCWMAQNLNIGDMIPGGMPQSSTATIQKYCYGNDPGLCDVYGGIYQWNMLMQFNASSNSIPSGVQGICPIGWHVPSDAEWCILSTLLDPTFDCNISAYIWQGTDIGGQLKDPGPSWDPPNYSATNSSGFTALGGGFYWEVGIFLNIHQSHNWWTSTEEYPGIPLGRGLATYSAGMERGSYSSNRGCALRCLQD